MQRNAEKEGLERRINELEEKGKYYKLKRRDKNELREMRRRIIELNLQQHEKKEEKRKEEEEEKRKEEEEEKRKEEEEEPPHHETEEERRRKEEEKKKKKEEEIYQNLIQNSDDINYKEIAEYGKLTAESIKLEMERNPDKFITTNKAIESENEQISALGHLGKELEKSGIFVSIDIESNDNKSSIINNQILSSGLINKSKYEMHIECDDINKRKEIIYDERKSEEFIKEWKSKISKESNISEDLIVITNLREGSIKFDVIFKTPDFTNSLTQKNGNKIEINEIMKNISKNNPEILEIHQKKIIDGCKLSLNMLDSRGNQYPGNWAGKGETRGGYEYFPPDNTWIGYGLKVWDVYDNGNNDWIAMNGNSNEWAVAYH